MRKHRRLIAWLIILAAVAATPIAVRAAYLWRGYWAIGGEWLIMPMGLMAAWVVSDGASREGEKHDRRDTSQNSRHGA